MKEFFLMNWDKAAKCEHKNLYENYAEMACNICGGYEYHCRDCGIYFTDCRCGDNRGMSGWPLKRWKTYYKKRGFAK